MITSTRLFVSNHFNYPNILLILSNSMKYFLNRNLLSIWVSLDNTDLLHLYELNQENNKEETPYRTFLKEIFQYSDHIELFTFRKHSLLKLVQDQMDSRKHISVDTVNDMLT